VEETGFDIGLLATFGPAWPWPLPWIGSYGILSFITYRPLLTHWISFKIRKTFCIRKYVVRTDAQMYACTDVLLYKIIWGHVTVNFWQEQIN